MENPEEEFEIEGFDHRKPTVQMLGRWQPWHDGHTALFKKAHSITGQVCIMIRDVCGIVGEDVGGGRTTKQDDNPFTMPQIFGTIEKELTDAGYKHGVDFIMINVPNIVDISYGRGVGYTFTEHDLGEEVHEISATKIRAELRKKGFLK